MSDLVVNSVLLRNWLKFESTHVQFPESGLVAVSGVNNASGGKLMSVGSGKTGFGEAVGRGLFGVSARFNSLKEASRDGKGDTYVRIQATYMGKPLVVETGYKCEELSPAGEGLRFTYDGVKIERGQLAQTRRELDALLGLSPALAQWTIFVDGDHMKFTTLAQADAVELVMTALHQPPWSEYHEASKKTLLACNRAMAKEQGVHQTAQERVKEAQEAVYAATTAVQQAKGRYAEAVRQLNEKIQAKNAEADRIRQESAAKIERQQALTKEINRLTEEKASAQHALEIKYNEAHEKTAAAREALNKAIADRSTANSTYALAKENYESVTSVNEFCPTCKRPWHEPPSAELVAERRQTFEITRAQVQKAQAACDAQEARVRELAQIEETFIRQGRELGARDATRNASAAYKAIETELKMSDQALHRIELAIAALRQGVSDSEVIAAEATRVEREKVLTEAEAGLAAAAKSLAEAKQTVDVVNYWTTAFSPIGIPNMVLQDSIAPLNNEARRISAMMTGGTINVKFSTKRALATGEHKPQLVIEVDNRLGSKSAKFSSKGESGLTNFIISETLSAVGRVSKRVGFRWYDEIVPHQDAVVCQSLYAYLRDLAQAQGILIFIVDHNPAVENYADYFLRVEKTGEGDDCVSTANWI